MHAVPFTDPLDFAPRAAELLARHPAGYNVPASYLAERVAGAPTGPDELWLLVLEAGRPVAAAMHTPPFNLFVGPVEGSDPGRQDSVAGALLATLAGRPLPGVTGEATTASAVAQAWQAASGRPALVRMAEVVYEIGTPPPVPPVPGAPRRATEADLALLDRWLIDFHAEATPDQPWPGGQEVVRRMLAGRTLTFWDDAGPVSLAGVTRPSAGLSRIGPVYTPPEHRGRGYASALTAAAAAHGFASGARRVGLYADAANATSNGVYRRLGFQAVGDALVYSFG